MGPAVRARAGLPFLTYYAGGSAWGDLWAGAVTAPCTTAVVGLVNDENTSDASSLQFWARGLFQRFWGPWRVGW